MSLQCARGQRQFDPISCVVDTFCLLSRLVAVRNSQTQASRVVIKKKYTRFGLKIYEINIILKRIVDHEWYFNVSCWWLACHMSNCCGLGCINKKLWILEILFFTRFVEGRSWCKNIRLEIIVNWSLSNLLQLIQFGMIVKNYDI